MKYTKFYNSAVGKLAMITDGEALNALLLQKEAEEAGVAESAGEPSEGARKVFRLATAWLDRYFVAEGSKANPIAADYLPNQEGLESSEQGEAARANCDAAIIAADSMDTYTLNVDGETLLLRPEGSEFRREVWKLLCEIPYGQVVTYGSIAKTMAVKRGKRKMSAQAVGDAVGHNPIAIMIPCHRVVGSSGSLVGYGGGIPVKVRLLEIEGVDTGRFTIPSRGTKL